MALANSKTRYGSVTKVFHWLTAVLILINIPLGLAANRWPTTPETAALKFQLFSSHKTVGVAIFLIALARIFWATAQTRPGPLGTHKPAEVFLADVVYWLLFAALVIVPLSGWLEHAATQGYAPILWPFGQGLPLVPKYPGLAAVFAATHYVFARLLVLALVFHIAGALKHRFADRDQTLQRMLAHAPKAPDLRLRPRPGLAILAAVAIWSGAIVLGTALGLSGFSATGKLGLNAQPPTLPVASFPKWGVEPGATLGIEVQQFGKPLQGQFATWRADIRFDPKTGDLIRGTIDVLIDLTSLTLGSLTDQAMGPSYFDVQNHPTAHYSGTILSDGAGGHLVDGTLNLHGQAIATPMILDLTLSGDQANLTASTTLDRRDFGIGAQITDPAILGFAVKVAIKMKARRNP